MSKMHVMGFKYVIMVIALYIVLFFLISRNSYLANKDSYWMQKMRAGNDHLQSCNMANIDIHIRWGKNKTCDRHKYVM